MNAQDVRVLGDSMAAHARWVRQRAAADAWKLDEASREVFDADGTIAVCARAGDALSLIHI